MVWRNIVPGKPSIEKLTPPRKRPGPFETDHRAAIGGTNGERSPAAGRKRNLVFRAIHAPAAVGVLINVHAPTPRTRGNRHSPSYHADGGEDNFFAIGFPGPIGWAHRDNQRERAGVELKKLAIGEPFHRRHERDLPQQPLFRGVGPTENRRAGRENLPAKPARLRYGGLLVAVHVPPPESIPPIAELQRKRRVSPTCGRGDSALFGRLTRVPMHHLPRQYETDRHDNRRRQQIAGPAGHAARDTAKARPLDAPVVGTIFVRKRRLQSLHRIDEL